MIHDVGAKVTVIPSAADVQRIHDDPRVTVDRVEVEGARVWYWVRMIDGPVIGPYAKIEILDGWANA